MMKKWTHSGSLKQELSAREEKTQSSGEKSGGRRNCAS